MVSSLQSPPSCCKATMSTISYNSHASSFQFYQNPSSEWLLHNKAMDIQSQHQHQQFLFWEPTPLQPANPKLNPFTAFPPTSPESIELSRSDADYTYLWDSGQIDQKQHISALILRASERDCLENKVDFCDNLSVSTVTDEKYVLDGLYQGFDEEGGIVPSKAFGELPIPFFDDGIDVISFLGNTQNPCSPSDHSEAVGSIGSCSSASLNYIDKFGNEFVLRDEYPSEFEAVLGRQVPPLGQQDVLQILVNCAEALSEGHHVLVRSMVSKLQEFSSPLGDPLQRISFYVSEVLKKYSFSVVNQEENDEESSLEYDLAYQAFYQLLPYHQFMHFTSNQAILEAVDNASNIHIIDLEIRQGLQWPSFIQSLAHRPGGPPKLLKITAIGQDEKRLKQTGRRLLEFAESMEIAFAFHPVLVDLENLDESVLNIEAHETIAVNCSIVLHRLLCQSGKIHGLLALLRKLNPVVLTVMEIECNQSMPSTVGRFQQCLIFHRAVFNSIEAIVEKNNPDRVLIERVYVAPNISNVLVHDKDNSVMYACIDSWRKFLRHSGFKDSPLSNYSKCQAKLLLGMYTNDSFKLHEDGVSITLAWQDTPIVSVSAWTC